MKMDMLRCDLCDNEYIQALQSIAMMKDFVTKSFPCQMYTSDDLDKLELDDQQKQTIAKVLSCQSDDCHRAYLSNDEQGRVYFANFII